MGFFFSHSPFLSQGGADQYAGLGKIIDRSFHPGHGRGLFHFIEANRPAPMSAGFSRYIFPGAYIPSLREAWKGVLEPFDFSVVDVENLRRHYALTLAHWLARFEAAAPDIQREAGEAFTRRWRLYLAEAQAGFRAGTLQLFQVTFARGTHACMPWTRSALYTPREPLR